MYRRFLRGDRREAGGILLGVIFVVIFFVAALPSAAAQITVDGKGDDWIGLPLAGYDFLADPDGIMELNVSVCGGYVLNWSAGYDLADFAMFYNATSDTLYFKFNMSGVPGDTDGNYNPSNCDYCNPDYNCSTDPFEGWERADSDGLGVGVGKYSVGLSTTGDTAGEYRIGYQFNDVYVKSYDESVDYSASFTRAGSIGGPPWSAANVSNVVEFSITPAHNLTGFGECTDLFVRSIFSGSTNDYVNEDGSGMNLYANFAPVPVAVANSTCFRNNITFDGTSSYDSDGIIVNYTWNFGDGTVGYGATVEHYYEQAKAYTVMLTVTDDYGFVCSSSLVIYPCSQQVPILSHLGGLVLLGALSVIASLGVKKSSRKR